MEPTSRTARRAIDVAAVSAAVMATLGVLSYVVRGASVQEVFGAWVVHNAPLGIVGSLGMALALRRQPDNRAARFLFASSLLAAIHVTSLAAANAIAASDPGYTLVAARGTVIDLAQLPLLPGGLFWISTWVWVPAAVMGFVLGVPLLPDGRWPSPRWRRLELVAAVATAAFTAAWAIHFWPGRDAVVVYPELPGGNPLLDALFVGGGIGIAITAAVAVAAVVHRLRHAGAEERRRMRPVGVMALLTLVSMVVLYPWQHLWAVVSAVVMSLLLSAITVAVTRHQLFDVEVLVSRAVTAALLAAFVSLVYVGIVVGIGYVIGARDNLMLALAATAVVAVAFEPLRQRVARWTRRLVLGARSSPAEVIGQLSAGLEGAATTGDVLVQVAELLVAGTGADRAELRAGGELVAAAGEPPAHPSTRSAHVVSAGEVLGEVVLVAARQDLVLDADEELLARIAALLGPVLRNAELHAQLQQTIDELRASRQRLVLAEETVRRSVERDIHDGAQQQLLGLRLKLGLAAALADQGDLDRLVEVISAAAEDTDRVIGGLRDLARGMYPPVLEQEGLVAALRSHLRDVPMDTTVEAPDSLPRVERGVEAAVYLCCLETIQNVTKHAAASMVVVRLEVEDGALCFEVVDDGRGFEQVEPGVGLHSIRDRVEALGGTLRIDSAAGEGTAIRGCIPIAAARPAGDAGGSQAPSSTRQPSPVGESPVSAR